jgi:hypothetical protein
MVAQAVQPEAASAAEIEPSRLNIDQLEFAVSDHND